MELIVRATPTRAVASHRAVTDAESRDLVVEVDPSHTVGELTSALAAGLGVDPAAATTTILRTGELLDPAVTVAEVGVLSGDELMVGPPVRRPSPRPRPARAVAADVIAGPDSGRSMLLEPGRYRVGRSDDAHLVLTDRSVSRHHADVTVGADWSVSLAPIVDSANGVDVNGHRVTEAVRLQPDDVVALGGTRLVFRPVERGIDDRIDRLGQIDFHRTPYRPPVVAPRDDQVIGPIPSRPEPRRFQVLSVLAPLAAGLAMFAFTRTPHFLVLTALSPIVMIGNTIESRRSGRRKFRDQLATFRSDLATRQVDLDRRRHLERLDRLRSAPDLADLVRRAELRTIDLWARGRDAPDVLRLRLGLGDGDVQYEIRLDRGGDDDLRAEAAAAIAGLDRVEGIPITVDLAAGLLGVHGPDDLVDGVAASLIVQAATLHSPEDLTIVTAVAPERGFAWAKWLPHTRSVASPVPGSHTLAGRDGVDSLVSRLVEVAEFRTPRGHGHHVDGEGAAWPRILLVIDAGLGPDPAEVSRLLDLAPAAGIAVVWLAPSAASVPRQATEILALGHADGAAMVGRLWSTDPAVDDRRLEVEHLRAELADRVARALAPVRDASTASLATSIPRTAPLLDVLGVGHPSAEWVAESWLADPGYQLRFPIGIAADGPLELDLVHDGPHTLIGGTSGAGKSELLQSMVASLAARHAPTRLNFLFVDYKGGASSKVFEPLPHTVGYVTNLSAELSLRALTSLRAELERRMRILEGRAKDLADLLEVAPDDAPPSLVIVVDEFATLVKEVPEFVAGIVDIAQRGRSLGIHLVLATQRPSGSVNENILANTNLRMSLRMLDRTESSSIIDSPDAAAIPVPLRGRGFVRLGPRHLVEFQSAYAGAPLVTDDDRAPVLVGAFERSDDSARTSSCIVAATESVPTDRSDAREVSRVDRAQLGRTQLEAVIEAVVGADRALRLPTPRRPWRDVLPHTVLLDDVVADDDALRAERQRIGSHDDERLPGRHVRVGLLDAPERQEQAPAVVDLEDGGGWLIFGSGGSGKTTTLRTIAASISADARGDDVAIVAFDFASRGLAGLRVLPEVVEVATADDLEAVTRLLTVLDDELDRRRRLLAEAGAEHLTAYHRLGFSMPRIVVLIDGFGGLAGTFLGPTAGAAADGWADVVQRIIVDGRQAGIHTVITADRHHAVPSRIQSAIANRLVLRHADANSYAEHGIAAERSKHLELGDGRGLLNGTTTVQIACLNVDTSARAQHDHLVELADRLGRKHTEILASSALPEAVHLDELADGAMCGVGPRRVVLGIADVTGEPVVVDLDWSHLAVCGAPRSGRSTALATAVRGLAADHHVVAVGPSSSPLASLTDVAPHVTSRVEVVTGQAAAIAPVLERLANVLDMGPGRTPRVLVVDDADGLDDTTLTPLWTRLLGHDELRIVAALETRSMTGFTQNPLLTTIRRSRRVLALRPDDPSEFLALTGIKLRLRPGLRLPPGRGILLADRVPSVVQVAHP